MVRCLFILILLMSPLMSLGFEIVKDPFNLAKQAKILAQMIQFVRHIKTLQHDIVNINKILGKKFDARLLLEELKSTLSTNSHLEKTETLFSNPQRIPTTEEFYKLTNQKQSILQKSLGTSFSWIKYENKKRKKSIKHCISLSKKISECQNLRQDISISNQFLHQICENMIFIRTLLTKQLEILSSMTLAQTTLIQPIKKIHP